MYLEFMELYTAPGYCSQHLCVIQNRRPVTWVNILHVSVHTDCSGLFVPVLTIWYVANRRTRKCRVQEILR